MKNREITEVLCERLDPATSESGFSRKRNRGLWLRKPGSEYDLVYIQMDKWGWDPWAGTTFTVNFQRSKHAETGLTPGAKFARVGDLLRGDHRKEAERIHNDAIAKIRVPTREEYEEEIGFGDESSIKEYEQLSITVRFNRQLDDLWLRIVDAADARSWGAFLGDWFPEGLKEFENAKGDRFFW